MNFLACFKHIIGCVKYSLSYDEISEITSFYHTSEQTLFISNFYNLHSKNILQNTFTIYNNYVIQETY